MVRRRGLLALAVAASLALAGCSATPPSVIAGSVMHVGADVPYTGAGPAAPASTLLDRAVGAASLAGFSVVDAAGERVPDPGFGAMTVVSADPLAVRYTVADGIAWSDGVGIDGVDLLLDWAARSHPFAGVAFGSEADLSLSSATSVELSEDRKSVTIAFSNPRVRWQEAFAAPLPAHAIAARAFGSESPEHAKDDVIEAIDAAEAGDLAPLRRLADAWSTAFALDAPPLPASGPYAIDSAAAGLVELGRNPEYGGSRRPTFERLELRTLPSAAAAVQALAVGELDLIQVASSEDVRGALGRIGAERAEIPGRASGPTVAGWFRLAVDHVEPASSELGALWNPWAWTPNVRIGD